LKLEDAPSVFRRINRTIENMNAYLSMHMDDEEGAKKREHPRFEKKSMFSQFRFIDHPRYKGKVFKAPLFDVSVGGMCFEVDHDIKIQLKDEFHFSVMKEGIKKVVLSGRARVVRVRQLKNTKQLGIQFTELTNK